MKRLVKISKATQMTGASAFVICYNCGEHHPATDSWADMARIRYYCNPCVEHRMPEGPKDG
jgi:hypothetical protein